MTTSFGAMGEDDHQQVMMGGGGGCGGGDSGGEIWLERQQENLLDVNDSSMFYTDFPPLPDFPCMSSSSSSSSTQAPVKPSTCSSASSSSSSAASWTVLKSDAEEDHAKASINHHSQDYHFRQQQQQQQQQQLFYEENMNIPLDASASGGALSSTASMELIHHPHEEDNQTQMEGVECMDVMENFGYMDLLESNDFFDPSSIFSNESPLEEYQQEQEPPGIILQEEQQQHSPLEDPKPLSVLHYQLDENPHEREHEHELPIEDETGDDRMTSDEMAEVFLEWLRTNRDNVSAEDLRKIKIKKSTIESAARRLGGGRAAMKQLLKLILEWVQTNHLHKKRAKESSTATVLGANTSASQFSYQYQDTFQNPNPSINSNVFSPEPNQGFASQAPWIPPPPAYTTTPAPFMDSSGPAFPPMHVGYMGDYIPYSNCGPDVNCGNPYTPQPEFPLLDTTPSWQLPQYPLTTPYNFAESNIHTPPPLPHPQSFGGCGSAFQYPYQGFFNGHGQRFVRLGSSATKEARKKRMARQHRRLLSHHRNHSNNHNHSHHQGNQQTGQPNQVFDQHARVGFNEGCPSGLGQVGNPSNNWLYWPSAAGGAVLPPSSPVLAPEPLQVVPVDRPPMHPQNYSRPATTTDRRQGWKPENNLKFLLQKVLKQSDVGNLGRIVLPKKEAETHLPELEARDGISIAMEDIGTSRVWNMRYRFWPNNKSRMYLLENTGDFVRMNGLQEGDFIVIYSDVKCGKYLIRGVKVRQQEGNKAETNRPEKLHKNLHAAPSNNNVNVSSSHPSQRRN